MQQAGVTEILRCGRCWESCWPPQTLQVAAPPCCTAKPPSSSSESPRSDWSSQAYFGSCLCTTAVLHYSGKVTEAYCSWPEHRRGNPSVFVVPFCNAPVSPFRDAIWACIGTPKMPPLLFRARRVCRAKICLVLNCTGALKSYKKSLELHKQLTQHAPQENGNATESSHAGIPARLLNNAAVVFLACGKQREALDLVIEATQVNCT